MNTPQAVTTRYATNLLHRGKNNEFKLLSIERQLSLIEDVCVGEYYEALVRESHTPQPVSGVGMTPIRAVMKALEKLNVTFK